MSIEEAQGPAQPDEKKEWPYREKWHPELREGEIFLENAFPPDIDSGTRGANSIGWKTKRLGDVAYDKHGDPLGPHVKPVFVSKQEVEDAGYTFEN